MTDPHGFKKVPRRVRGLRPVNERLEDYGEVHLPVNIELATEQSRRCMDCGVPFCHVGCPLGNQIPDWNDLVHQGDWWHAFERLHATNNFPEFTGMLCPAPCEDACVLALENKPVAIKEIELAIVEHAFEKAWIRPVAPARGSALGKWVAVVGSGPAGLAAAQQLTRVGYRVTVFERDDRVGGLLRYGIPDFKLPKDSIDRRLGQMEAEGTQFEVGVSVGRDVGADELREQFDAVVLATGAQAHRDLGLPGRDQAGIHFAMPYLTQRNRHVAGLPIAESLISAAGRRVAIIGAGDTSADCLGNVLREKASLVYEIGHGPMPAERVERNHAWPDRPFVMRTYPVHGEGGERMWQWEPLAFEGDGRVTGLRGRRVEFPAFDPGVARKRPRDKVEGENVSLDVDLVLIAIGFAGAERDDSLFEQLQVGFGENNTISVDDHATSVPGVFAAGDCVLGADLIVSAIAQGRECARSVDRYLRGETRLPSRDFVRSISRFDGGSVGWQPS